MSGSPRRWAGPAPLLGLLTLALLGGCKGGDRPPPDPAAEAARNYGVACGGCHGLQGEGQGLAYPPLAEQLPALLAAPGGRAYLREVAAHGVTGPLSLPRGNYEGLMPPVAAAPDALLAGALTHAAKVLGAAGPGFEPYSAAEIAKERGRAQTPAETLTHRPQPAPDAAAPKVPEADAAAPPPAN